MFILLALRIHLTRLSTEGLGPRHGEVRRAHQMLNAALIDAAAYCTMQAVWCNSTNTRARQISDKCKNYDKSATLTHRI